MSEISEESITPSESGSGSLGTSARRWGVGHFASLFKSGKEVAVVDGQAFTNPTANDPNPNADEGEITTAAWVRALLDAFRMGLELLGESTTATPASDDDSTRIANTEWVQALAEEVKTYLKDRENHTGTQLASTISDFASAVAGLPAGQKAHDQNQDTQIVGAGGAITADTIAGHIANDAIHTQIDDNSTGSTKTFSAERIIALVNSAVSQGVGAVNVDAVVGLGLLAKLDAVATAKIEDEAITPRKLAGGPNDDDVPNGYVYGVDPIGNIGFFLPAPDLGVTAAVGRALLTVVEGKLYVQTGTTSQDAAVGNDARFPTTDQKAALDAAYGTPDSENPYLTESWHDEWVSNATISPGDLNSETPDNNPGLVSAATLLSAFVRAGTYSTGDLNADVPSNDPGLFSPAALIDKFADRLAVASREEEIDGIIEGLQSALAGKISFATLLEKWQDGNVFDGDVLDVDYPPRNYAPRSEGIIQAKDSGDLAAHLAGIDDKIGNIASGLDGIVADGVPANISGSTVNYTPVNYVPSAATVQGHFQGVDQKILTPTNIFDPNKLHADKLHIHWEPTNYTPTSVGVVEVSDNSDLTAHLVGIDKQLAGVGTVSMYERQLVSRNNYVTLGAYYHIFGTAVPGTIRKVEIETGPGAVRYTGIKLVVNGIAVGNEITPNYGFPLRETIGEVWPVTARVGRIATDISVLAGRAIGVLVTADGSEGGGTAGVYDPCKGLRVVIWFSAT